MTFVSTFIDRPRALNNINQLIGTLGLGQLPRNITGRGTLSGVQGSFRNLIGSAGSFARAVGSNLRNVANLSIGSLGLPRLPRDITGRGTVAGVKGSFPTYKGTLGSFQRTIGTNLTGASGITSGTFGVARIPVFAGLTTLRGRLIGSVQPPTTGANNNSIAISARGDLWIDQTTNYIVRVGTLALRAGTNSRIGTQIIGSMKHPTGAGGIDFNSRGELWKFAQNDYVYRYGTLGLRAGTNSRIGTVLIGSFAGSSSGNTPSIAFDFNNHLWMMYNSQVRRVRIDALSAGTGKRQNYTNAGTLARNYDGLAFTRVGRLMTISAGQPPYFQYFGTFGQVGGTQSQLWIEMVGSFPVTGRGTGANLFFKIDRNGNLWRVSDGNDAPSRYIYKYGTYAKQVRILGAY